MNTNTDDLQYAGFWVRVGASLIDSILLMLVTTPLLVAIYGWAGLDYGYAVRSTGFVDILVTWILPVVAVIWFWVKKQATPGKLLLSLRVVDAKTGWGAGVLVMALLSRCRFRRFGGSRRSWIGSRSCPCRRGPSR